MYITCQQCSTIFRLDESLLKPTGSKVRCSQCRNVFVEYPQTSEAGVSVPVGVAAIKAESEMSSEALYDQELEGIDLDELDAIFEHGDINTPSLSDDSEAQVAARDDDVAAELDDQDLEMDFDLETASESAQAVQVEDAAVEETGENLEDLDLELDFELETDKPQEDQPSAELESGVDDISEDMGLDLDDLDFSLDDDMAEAVVADADTDTEAGEKVDLIDNLDEDASDLDLNDGGDFDLDIDLSADPSPEESEGDDFDLAELDDMLGGNDTSGKVSAGVTRDVIDENAELALDDTSEDEMALESTPALDAKGTKDSSEGLDLSDLDAMLDEVDGQTDQDAQITANDEGGTGKDTAARSDVDEDLEELNFELDAEFEDKAITEDSVEDTEPELAQDEEIDLSDIEQMLGDDEDPLDTQQLEADFLGLDGDNGEKWSDGDAPELDLDDTDEIDLNEIEAAIDQADSGLVEDTIRMGPEDEELSLDGSSSIDEGAELELDDDIILELETDDSEPQVEEEQALDDDLDLSDLDLGEEQASEDVNDVIDAGDIELEFQIEDDQPVPDSVDAPDLALDTQEASQDFSIEDTVPTPPVDETLIESAPPEPQKTKKSTSKGLVFVFIALLLGGAGYLYYAIAYQGMDIPYVSQYLKPKPKDPAGIFKLFTTDINSKFVDTDSSGRLFVIEGNVRNGYSAGRQMIRLQGKLFTKGKVLAKSEFAYAGVSIADQALNSQPVAGLKKKLNSGIAQGAAAKVNPGGLLPFMIIFSELPDELDEFAIEVISSMPSK